MGGISCATTYYCINTSFTFMLRFSYPTPTQPNAFDRLSIIDEEDSQCLHSDRDTVSAHLAGTRYLAELPIHFFMNSRYIYVSSRSSVTETVGDGISPSSATALVLVARMFLLARPLGIEARTTSSFRQSPTSRKTHRPAHGPPPMKPRRCTTFMYRMQLR